MFLGQVRGGIMRAVVLKLGVIGGAFVAWVADFDDSLSFDDANNSYYLAVI